MVLKNYNFLSEKCRFTTFLILVRFHEKVKYLYLLFVARYYFAVISFEIALLNKHKKGLDVSVILPQLPFSNILRGWGLVKDITVVFSDCHALQGNCMEWDYRLPYVENFFITTFISLSERITGSPIHLAW